jgi:hypothetical protein
MLKSSKKILALFVALLLLSSALFPVYAAGGSGIQGHWAAAVIQKWVDLGLAKGGADGAFRPDDSVTRAELAVFLNRIFRYTEGAEATFADVPASAWYRDDITKAVAAGIIQAKSGDKIGPGDRLSRQEAARMIAAAFGWKAADLSRLGKFPDSGRVGSPYRDAVCALVEKGCISGRSGGLLAPLDGTTRAEVVKMLDMAMGELKNAKGTYTGNVKGNLVVNTRDVVLSNMTIGGDLYLTQGIGDGNVTLDGVTVKGKTIVSGGGMNSIHIRNSSLAGSLVVIKVGGQIRIVAEGSTVIDGVELRSGARLEESGLTGGGFGGVEILGIVEAGQQIILDGDFDRVGIEADHVGVEIAGGTVGSLEVASGADGAQIHVAQNAGIGNLTLGAAAAVTGQGTITSATINAPGVTLEQKPAAVNIAAGITATVGGAVTTGASASTGGGGSSDGTTTPDSPPDAKAELFDDFNYANSSDPALAGMGWHVKHTNTEGPGPAGCTWTRDNVAFVDDAENSGNKLARLTSSTDGTAAGTYQSEIVLPQKFYEGTYATRVKFADLPLEGAAMDGDAVVETFFTITPLNYDLDPDYCEYDFEYLPNGGWGDSRMMYETSWETYCNDPWIAVNTHGNQPDSLEGWHTLILTIRDGVIKYYIDGVNVATHGGIYYPEVPMSVNFNLWFINGGFNSSLSGTRTYQQDIDWVYYLENTELTPEQVQTAVNGYRSSVTRRTDTVKMKNFANIPSSAQLSADKAVNTGDYTITATVPANNKATSLRLYENDILVKAAAVTANSASQQKISFPVTGKAAGDYTYRAELSNANGTRAGADVTVSVIRAMFDDFNYEDCNDPKLSENGWVLKNDVDEGPGIANTWKKEGVSFPSDSDLTGNKLARLTSSTDGTVGGTTQSEIYTGASKFYEGTYAARVKFSDTPASGPDGDPLVQTFFNITLHNENNPTYGEHDFEYLPNGGWGEPGSILYATTWENVIPDPWWADRVTKSDSSSYAGWHDLVLTIKDGHSRYYIDGVLFADHSGKYYPEIPMIIDFNQWFINLTTVDSSETRKWQEDIDWVYFAEDKALTTEQVKAIVNGYRTDSVTAFDNVQEKTGERPEAASLSVDSSMNNGTYLVSATVPAHNTAKSMRLYENDELVLGKELTADSSGVQSFAYNAENKALGQYTYRAELTNANGTTATSDLIVEVVAGSFPANIAAGKPATGQDGTLYGNITAINDGIYNDSNAFSGNGSGLMWAQIDFKKSYDVNKVMLWHYYDDGRTYKDVVIQLSNDPAFAEGVTTVFNNDRDNSAGLGAGTDLEYAETAGGKTIHFNTVNARYIRLYSNGSRENAFNHYVEVQVWSVGGDEGSAKLSADKVYNRGNYTVTAAVPANSTATAISLYENDVRVIDAQPLTPGGQIQEITFPVAGKADGVYTYKAELTGPEGTLASGSLAVTVSSIPEPAVLSVDHAINDGSYTVTVTVPAGNSATSLDLFEGASKVIDHQAVTENSPSPQQFTYAASGKAPGKYTYRADLKNASGTMPGLELSVIVMAQAGEPANVAADKTTTAASEVLSLADAQKITDGDKSSDKFAGAGDGLQWIMIDLGQSYDIDTVKVWHYFDDGRTYHDVIVQVSNDVNFSAGVTTVFNNDKDNSAGQGTGTEEEYAETSAGKTIGFPSANARYIRLWSNGSTGPYAPANHYIEVEVWTAP